MSDATLITPRRNFLVRALGFTAAGATLSVPIVTVDSAEARLRHHMAGVEAASRDIDSRLDWSQMEAAGMPKRTALISSRGRKVVQALTGVMRLCRSPSEGSS